MLVFTAYAIGLTRAARWQPLHRLFDAPIAREYKESRRVVEMLFLWAWKGTENDAWKQIEGLEQRRTPLSDHLFGLFTAWGKSFIGIVADFESIYERYEVLGSLTHLERNQKTEVQAGLAAETQRPGAWMPVGRTGWNERNGDRLLSQIQSEPLKTTLLTPGFGKGHPETLDLFLPNYTRYTDRMRW